MILTGLTKPTREENEDQKFHKSKQDRKGHKRPEIEKKPTEEKKENREKKDELWDKNFRG